MYKYIISISLLINSIFSANAQQSTEPERLINNLIQSLNSSAIRTNFTLKFSEKNDLNSQQISGRLLLKGQQFYLDMNEMQVWFDGKTQWTYLPQSNEVSITEPSEEELGEINPVALLIAFRSKSNLRAGRSRNTQNHLVEFTPKSNRETFTKVEVEFAKASGNLVSIRMENRDGSRQEISLSNYQRNVAVQPENFTFDRSKFRNVIINDLR